MFFVCFNEIFIMWDITATSAASFTYLSPVYFSFQPNNSSLRLHPTRPAGIGKARL